MNPDVTEGWPLPWHSDVEERRKAEQVARGTRDAVRQADLAAPPQQHYHVVEDENGFVELDNYRIGGGVWRADEAVVDDDDPPWPWLHGAAGHG